MTPTYLFLLVPNYCGSTLLWKMISTSSAVSSMPKEGQFMPGANEIMRTGNQWSEDLVIPWERIKEIWHQSWDAQKPILIEKSPPNLMRAAEIACHFQPFRAIIMTRDPYAHCEAMIRRHAWDAARAAHHAIKCLRAQARNVEILPDSYVTTYEKLVADPATVCAEITAFLPALGHLDHAQEFTLHSMDGNVTRGVVSDLNERKLAALGADNLHAINAVFHDHVDALAAWGYKVNVP